MGMSCRFSMLRLGSPPLQSSFPNNSSPIHYSPSIRAREAYFESVRFSFLTTSTEEKEILYPDSLRAHTCMSPAPQIIGNDYSEIEMISNARSHKGLHNMMNYTQESMERTAQCCFQPYKCARCLILDC
ncbi:hypothetical protein Nepgr_012632 [Nepenthes gracilis]|uniref:Uncharacterized protein n=1 Tax=Nepenthes gracilis TaxID=150966 RepID=A0AAD3SHG1_NEPGR|nr:hypothetical protein Nepgr_012632 [Nepenthes gracilis]